MGMPNLHIKTNAILLVQTPGNPKSDGIRNILNDNLQRRSNVAIVEIQSRCTFVSDGLAVMAKMMRGSV